MSDRPTDLPPAPAAPDAPGLPVGHQEPAAPRRRRRSWVIGAVVLALLVAAAWVQLPYYAVGPGPARNVVPLIRFDGPQRYEPTGQLVMTTVRYFKATPLQALVKWLDPNWAVLPERDVIPPGSSVVQDQTRGYSQMDQSKIDAAYVVLSHLTSYPKDHRAGALVEGTAEGCPAFGHLYAGDVITSIDGERINDLEEARKILDAAQAGDALRFGLNVDGKVEHASFTKRPCGSHGEALIGVSLIPNFPFDVQISSGDVGGPSAGLMFALGLYELLTPGNLTDGRVIAGTGELGPDGTVYPIGGIRDKVVAAEQDGATVFLVPKDNMDELKGVDTGDMRLISVGTFDEALSALKAG